MVVMTVSDNDSPEGKPVGVQEHFHLCDGGRVYNHGAAVLSGNDVAVGLERSQRELIYLHTTSFTAFRYVLPR